ncbi:MAG: hypothetical protein PVJ39_14535 [Gammaproteobacteria bacterium]|jgi:hypothetical protein
MAVKKARTKKKTTKTKASGKSASTASKTRRAPRKKQTASTKKQAGSAGEQARSKSGNGSKGKKKQQKNKQQAKGSKGLAAEAVRIVEQAASILEEEISAGIVAARKVEERYVNVNSLRSEESREIIQRFRKDAHEVLDIVLDLINLSINAVSGLGERAMNIRSTTVPKDNNGTTEETVPELVIPEALKPGESGKVGMLVENESENATEKFSFSTSGLLDSAGNHLGPDNIQFDPASLEVGANDLEKVNITVSIPEATRPGHYSGVVQAAAIQMRALLTVHVEAP